MDPLTTLLAAAAATGPNTLQSQALTALRSAGPQESFFTRMGNPHPLQLQQLAQPATPQLNPIIAQPTSAPTALSQQPPMPILPLAFALADPAPTALHIPLSRPFARLVCGHWTGCLPYGTAHICPWCWFCFAAGTECPRISFLCWS